MAFDLSTGRTKVGLLVTDLSQDAEIGMAMNAALAYAEHYCDRRFLYAREKIQKVYDRANEAVFVDRYPIVQVHAISGASASGGWKLTHDSAGIIFGGNRGGYGYGGGGYHRNFGQTVTIDYEGGYKALPADLEYAFWKMFGSVWGDYDPSTTAAIVTGGPAIGAVKKQTIVGVGSIDYETGSAPASAAAGVAADLSAVMPGAVQATLDMYARRVA